MAGTRLKGLMLSLLAVSVLRAPLPAEAASLVRSDTMTAGEGSPTSSTSGDPAQGKRNQLTIDAGVFMGSVTYARRVGDSWSIGGGAGVSGDFLGFMVVAGRHYSEHNGWSYEEKDGFEDKSLIDIVHANVFARYAPRSWFHADLGIRGSIFLHFDSSDDDPGSGAAAGIYINPMIGWRRVKFGPSVTIGGFWGCADAGEFGVYASPFNMRVLFDW